MNRRLRIVGLLVMFTALVATQALAQSEEDLVRFLKSSEQDASKLTEAYISPVVEGLSYSLSGGWYTTAKTHKTLGFDLGVSINTIFIPTSQNYANINDLDLETTTLVSPADGRIPTIIGPKSPTTLQSQLDIDGDGDIDQTLTYAGPEGLDFKNIFKFSGLAAPTATLGIGIYKGTDIRFRMIPEVTLGSSSFRLIGGGIMHDIKQHIPGIKLLPFDLSVIASYQRASGETDLTGEFATNSTAKQRLEYSMDSWLVQALISKKIALVTFYGGIGYNGIITKADILGSYIIVDNPGTAQDFEPTDPVNLSINTSSLRLTAGIRLNLGPIYISTDYSYQTFNNLSVGLGVTVR